MADESSSLNTIELATELTIAWLNNPNNRVSADEVPAFLQRMHTTLNGLETGQSEQGHTADDSEDHKPAVTVRKSLGSPDHILSMIDGKPYKTLRRHLSRHGLTPEQYRERYNLKPDYPMVAPNYSEHRRAMAHKIGLGARGRDARAAASDGDAAAKPQQAARAAQGDDAKPKRASRKPRTATE
ncbi:MucR family transcriptional regulator [Sphingomonas sp.]|uniref:MucR family transcriptional regulator n=1 Tax=Sphingomonas sp. TaxID=28214 RepID=UPI002E0EB3AA